MAHASRVSVGANRSATLGRLFAEVRRIVRGPVPCSAEVFGTEVEEWSHTPDRLDPNARASAAERWHRAIT
ncbi:hypothetical protein GCM10009590_10050 [Brachybacterium alimentarium]